jgi:hypothetical protein
MMNAKIRGGKLHVVLDLEEPRPSATGKTEVVAGTGGRWRSGLKMNGKPVWVIATAYIYPEKIPDQRKGRSMKGALKKSTVENDDNE